MCRVGSMSPDVPHIGSMHARATWDGTVCVCGGPVVRPSWSPCIIPIYSHMIMHYTHIWHCVCVLVLWGAHDGIAVKGSTG